MQIKLKEEEKLILEKKHEVEIELSEVQPLVDAAK
jgi:hypothetical protein